MAVAPLIGVVGLARSGKDTFADVLNREQGHVKVAFADKLRAMATAIDPVVGVEPGRPLHYVTYTEAVDTYGYEGAKDRLPEFRRFLQRLGTEGIREHVADSYWVDEVERRIRTEPGPFVITDVRFPNEVDMIRRNGGEIVAIVRPTLTVGGGHVSESNNAALVEAADVRINNDGSLEDYLSACGQFAGGRATVHV